MAGDDLPTLYEYYCKGGVESGLSDKQTQFTLNSKNIVLYSGALHYFRVPQIYWRDRLRKFRAAGLNAVETYVPWNLHEPLDGVFDFGSGGSDYEEFLDIVKFIKLAKEEDLFVILRPGPYICAEWEYGGLPSWLLRYEGIKVRTSDEKYISFVNRYFQKLLELLEPLQFTKGGPIIAVQIENEYGNVKDGENYIDSAYLQTLKNILQNNGIVELLFTSDTPAEGFSGTLSGVLATANFQEKPIYELGLLKTYQPDKPMMVMEYWTGWFDHWTEKHHTRTAEKFGEVLEEILAFGASVNMYMFHGGTNWGFLNGANVKGLLIDNEGVYDFGSGNNDMSDFLHLQEFLKTAQEEDLFAIVRSGPFICAEFEFGGLPSWLLREDKIEVRTSNAIYMNYVRRWFNVLLPILAFFQFTRGGPILAFQVDNEYSISGKHDLEYLKQLRTIILENGIKELLVTSDNPKSGTYGTLPEYFLLTANYDTDPHKQLDMLKALQPNRPIMTMEYWSGWFDFWGDKHISKSFDLFKYNYEQILTYPSSVNMYMFVGGTNFGFLNGASNKKFDDWNTDYHSITSSYDYLSPISEAGECTEKYWAVKTLLEKYNPIKTRIPAVPESTKLTAYPTIKMQNALYLNDLLTTVKPIYSKKVISMEKLDINGNSGQSYGYIVYRKTNVKIPANAYLEIEGRVCDTVMVLVNGILVSPWLEKSADMNRFGTSRILNSYVLLSSTEINDATIDIVVENWGRVNVGVYKQFKGLWQGGVTLNNNSLYDWTIYPLEFNKAWTTSFNNWHGIPTKIMGPSLYKGVLQINGNPQDTFVYMENWRKGIVIVNGFVLGRYARMGPVQTLYLPATLLHEGENNIYVFEHFKPDLNVPFSTQHVYKSY